MKISLHGSKVTFAINKFELEKAKGWHGKWLDWGVTLVLKVLYLTHVSPSHMLKPSDYLQYCKMEKTHRKLLPFIWFLWWEWETHVHGNYLNQTNTWHCIIFPSLKILASTASWCKTVLWLQFEGKIYNTSWQNFNIVQLCQVVSGIFPSGPRSQNRKWNSKHWKLPSAGWCWSRSYSIHKSLF